VKGNRWFHPDCNNHEAGSSSSAGVHHFFCMPAAWPPRTPPTPSSEWCVYVVVKITRQFTQLYQLLTWLDVYLPRGCHQNQPRVSMSAIPMSHLNR
jgi:hypothetical protein